MIDRFDDFARNTMDGMKEGAGDITRHALADIGDSYQEVLMSSASVSPPEGLTGSMEQVTVEADIAPEISAPDIDMEHGQ
jgi:hypothetical protein